MSIKILDLQSGHIHEYGTNSHDSLRISEDGKSLSYCNMQNSDGSMYGDYRFVMDDGKIPAESQTADALHAECFFNIGGFGNGDKTSVSLACIERAITLLDYYGEKLNCKAEFDLATEVLKDLGSNYMHGFHEGFKNGYRDGTLDARRDIESKSGEKS